MNPPFDVIVLGSGPAGRSAGLQAAKAGKRVAIVENHSSFGGGCVLTGTLPSKSFRESVYRWSLGSRGTLGRELEHSTPVAMGSDRPEMDRLIRRKDRVVLEESKVVEDQLARNNIALYRGSARFVGLYEIEVTPVLGSPLGLSERLIGNTFFIATGSRPISSSVFQRDGELVHDSDSILSLEQIPETLVVLGAGIIGCEYTSMFCMAGSKVYLIDRRHEILANVDREVVAHLTERFEASGVEVLLKAETIRIEKDFEKKRCIVHLSSGHRIISNAVFVAMGRHGNTESLGLEGLGLKPSERGLLEVNGNFQTEIPHIYAIGDVIGAPALAATSYEQGRLACLHALGAADPGQSGLPAVYPYGIYTIPEISMIGITEEQAVEQKLDFVVGRGNYRELARGQIVGDHWGLLKILVERKTLKLLGVHIVGDNAADLIHIGQAVMILGGDVNYFIHSVFNYPTLAEGYKTAAFNAVNLIKGIQSGPQ